MIEIESQAEKNQGEEKHKNSKHKGLYKRGNVWWLRYVGIDGRIVRQSSQFSKFKDAWDLLIERRNEVKEGKQPEVKRILNHTFKELSDEYEKWAERQRCFKSKVYVISHLSERFGSLPLRHFNTMLIEQYQTERMEKGNKPATINRLIATLKHMFTKAVEWELVEEQTLKRIRKVKFLEENNRRLRYLSKEECHSLINSCDNHLRPIVITALHTGMRRGEILNLKREENLDLKHGAYGFVLLKNTKNGERREIPINKTLRETLDGLIPRLDTPYVFYDPATGKPYKDIKRSFNSACRRAGIKDFHFHDLRHTFASHLVMEGQDITTVKELLGHKTLAMTMRYAHLSPSHKAKAVQVLDCIFNGDEKSTAQLVHNLKG